MKTKEETKQGATFTQVVPKSLMKNHPFSGTLPKLPQSQFLWTLSQREVLMKAELRLQEAKELTKDLLDHETNDREGLELDQHRKCVEFDKWHMEMITLIAGEKGHEAKQRQ